MKKSRSNKRLEITWSAVCLAGILSLSIIFVGVSQPTLTKIEREIYSTADYTQSNKFAELGGILYLPFGYKILAFDESFNSSEITLDATNGTPQQVSDIVPLGNKLFIDSYSFHSFYNEPALVDPSNGSVTMIKDIHPTGYSYPRNLFSTGTQAFFQATDGTDHAVWVTDGTEEGTFKLASIGSYSKIISYFQYGDLVYMYIDHREVWITNGSMEGTFKLAEGWGYNSEFKTVSTEKYFYFMLRNYIDQEQIYRSDGTAENTGVIAESYYTYYYGENHVFEINNKVIYSLFNSEGSTEFYEFDEQTLSATKRYEVDGRINSLYSNGTIAYFEKRSGLSGTLGLWKTNGTLQGTSLVKPSEINGYRAGPLAGFAGDKFLFSYYTRSSGVEPWVTDGTSEGTKLLKDINPGPYSSMHFNNPPYSSQSVNLLFFKATSPSTGLEFWVTDGTENGTYLMEDINKSSKQLSVMQILPTTNKLYVNTSDSYGQTEPQFFELDDGGTLVQNSLEGDVTYYSEGLAEVLDDEIYLYVTPLNPVAHNYQSGLAKIESDNIQFASPPSTDVYPYGLVNENNRLFFTTFSDGYEPWVLDKTISETPFRIKDIAPGPASSMPANNTVPLSIKFSNGRYFFAANDNLNGNELWSTDLTESGTNLAMDLAPGSVSSNPKNFFTSGDILYFTTDIDNNYQVWAANLTENSWTQIAQAEAVAFYSIGNHVYFLTSYNYNSHVVWKTDGTLTGTVELLDLGNSNYETPIIQFEDGLIFISRNTTANTFDYNFVDIEGNKTLFKSGGEVLDLFGFKNYVYYIVGNDLWMTNGRDLDKFITSLFAPSLNSFNKMFTKFRGDVFFKAYDGSIGGNSLWKLNLFENRIGLYYESSPLASSETINFGSFSYGNESSVKTISVKNNGYVDWEFPEGFSLQVSGEAAADFIISNPLFPAVLKPGESFDIDVKFAPTNGGIREGYIDLQSTDELLSSIRVNLTGTGVNFPQNISFSLQKDIPFRKEPFELPAFASSQLPLTFTSSNNDIATFTSEGFVTKKFGTVTITASQPGNEYFLPAAQVQKEINITIGVQSVGLNVPTTYTYGDAPFQLSGTTSSGNPIKAFSSGNSNLLSIEGSTATIHGTGTVVLTATVDGNEFFQAGEQTFTFTINKAPQTITFPALTAKTFGDAAFDLSAASSSDLAVTFASSDETVATVTGTTVTILKAGTTTITASKPGTDNFLAATPVGQVLTVNKASQTIAFEPLEAMTFGDGTLELSATASNALPVTFSSSDPTIASVADNTLSILKAGAVTITAAQAGNDNYAAAVAQQPFTINKASQSISFDELPTLATSDESIPLVAEASSGLPLTFTSADEAVAVIDGGLLMVAGGGETTITGSQPGNENYLAAEDVARVLVVEEVTGVGSELAGKISVYPNPVQSLLLISHSDLKAGNFAITSITGQLIATGQLEKSGSTRLQTRDLKEGVYLLTVSTHEGNVVYRFIKEN